MAGELGPDRNNLTVRVDLPAQTVTLPSGKVVSFDVPAERKQALLEGLDDISMTLQYADDIADFQARDRAARPWIYAATWHTDAKDKPMSSANAHTVVVLPGDGIGLEVTAQARRVLEWASDQDGMALNWPTAITATRLINGPVRC